MLALKFRKVLVLVIPILLIVGGGLAWYGKY